MLLAILLILPTCALARYEDRYDLNQMPFDLRPVQKFIGLWELESSNGRVRDLPAPSLIDFSINPVPKFGARSMNITHTYFDSSKNVIRSDYGFMPVKNATRRDPRVHVAYLTTSSEGYSMMEQGFSKDDKLIFHLKQFLRRSFDVGSSSGDLQIREFERQYELIDFHHMIMKVRAETAIDTENYVANYRKILY
ncbi:THAP4-heme-bd domain-containing protein [Aphelenchoides besseyi]|nr:THAP4-heme-bd domain-containing protein [Aphelenchoides besseyi]KAI6199901.1 THAP4-heme-bd domain-containing protein [Aphelenchoides besseyi]